VNRLTNSESICNLL